MPLTEQRDLECPHCDSTLFFAIQGIRQTHTGGIVYPPQGAVCLGCHRRVDTSAVLNKENVRRLEKELVEKQEQLARAQPSPVEPTKKPTPSSPVS